MLAVDVEKQQDDFYLYAGRMPQEIMKQLPPMLVFFSEFDYLRRDAIKMVENLQEAGKLLDYFSMPGTMHGYEIQGGPEAKIALQESKKAWVRYVDN